MQRRVGHHDAPPRQAAQRVGQPVIAAHDALEVRERMRLAQEVVRIDAVMAHQPEQRRAVALPIVRAQRAGFDAIEIQGGHGYLVHQFLSPVANRRRDEYGGPLENRMRFALDVVRRIRRSWPREKPLFFRMSVVDDAGWTLDDSVVLARTLKEAGVDVIDCSSGGMLDAVRGGPPIGYGYQVEYARRIRELADVRTMAVGLIVHGDQAETIVREGSADLVALGREFLHNPNWPLDAAQKMGVAGAFGLAPARVGFWLEKRARVRGVRPSTWGRGIDGDEGAPREPAGEPGAKRP